MAVGVVGVSALTLIPFLGALHELWGQVFGLHVAVEGMGRGGNLNLILGTWWELPVIAVGLVSGIAIARRRCGGNQSLAGTIFVAWGVITLIILLAQAPLFAHHLALLTPPFVLAAACLPVDLTWMPRGKTSMPAISGLVSASLVLMGVMTTVVQQTDQRNHPPLGITVAAVDLADFTLPGDEIITDDQMIAILADRDVPPSLADTSLVRIAAGQVTTKTVTTAAVDPRVTAILWYSGRFDRLPGLRSWIEARFIRVVDYGEGRGLYVRSAPTLPVG
jgi:hypothetical protein